jgi:predicted transcriptional regulator
MEVLASLDRHGEMTASEIRVLLHPFRPMSHPSVVTLLGRLEEKGLVTRRKGNVGKSFIYSATREAKRVNKGLLRRVVRRIFADDPASLVASLFEACPPTEEELEQISSLVEAMEARRR